MRDINRIQPLLEKIESIWIKHPDLRLGQLISCAVNDSEDIFYIEDDKLLEGLDKFENKLKEKKYNGLIN